MTSADELITLWKERQNMVTETAKVQEADRKRQLKAASTGNASGSSEAHQVAKSIVVLILLNLCNLTPKRYTQLQPEIMAAYAEGRVK